MADLQPDDAGDTNRRAFSVNTAELQRTVGASIVALGLSARATDPLPGSLADIRDQAAREAIETCLKTGFASYRNVPFLTLVDACERMAYRRATQRQPIRW